MIEQQLAEQFAARFPAFCQVRAADSHKGNYGNAYFIGGAEGMTGAIVLAASAALFLGCGKSHAIFCQNHLPMPLLHSYPEIMLGTYRNPPPFKMAQAIAIGCGMGGDDATRQLLQGILQHELNMPLILDADALNLLAANPQLQDLLTAHTGVKVLTPHPLEAARLLRTSAALVQKNRLASAQMLAEQFSAYVILKGDHSIIINPDGSYIENDSGNAGLASAGTGDVLSGMLASFLAQRQDSDFAIGKTPIEQTLYAAVWLHGAAAQLLGNGLPLAGLLASEIAPAARHIRHLATISLASKIAP